MSRIFLLLGEIVRRKSGSSSCLRGKLSSCRDMSEREKVTIANSTSFRVCWRSTVEEIRGGISDRTLSKIIGELHDVAGCWASRNSWRGFVAKSALQKAENNNKHQLDSCTRRPWNRIWHTSSSRRKAESGTRDLANGGGLACDPGAGGGN